MAKKYVFTGYDFASAAYAHLVTTKQLPKPTEDFQYDWDVSMSDPTDKRTIEISFTLAEKEKPKPVPAQEPYKAGDWRDPEIE